VFHAFTPLQNNDYKATKLKGWTKESTQRK